MVGDFDGFFEGGEAFVKMEDPGTCDMQLFLVAKYIVVLGGQAVVVDALAAQRSFLVDEYRLVADRFERIENGI